MDQYAKQLKNKLLKIIRQMADDPSQWVRNPDKDFIRNRKITFEDVMRFLISSGGNSLNKELYDYFKPTDTMVSASALVQQRAKLLSEAFDYLLHRFNAVCRDTKTYMGYRLLAVDGSTMTFWTDSSEDTYMEHINCNQYHLNALYDLMNKVYVDAIVQPQPKQYEQKAAWQMMERMAVEEPCLLMGDRGYGGINLIEHINRIPNADYLLRIKTNLWKELRGKPMSEWDIDIELHLRTTQTNEDKEAFANGEAKWIPGHGKNKERKQAVWDFETPYDVKVRIVRIQLNTGEYETIATSLDREKFPPERIKDLYHKRWGIETSFRELKYSIGVTNFHAKKQESVLQEIFARLIMYNFCERITLQVVIENDKGRKWQYQANFTMGIHICRDYFRDQSPRPPDPEEKIKKYILPIRPNRADRRKVGQKPAVLFNYRVA